MPLVPLSRPRRPSARASGPARRGPNRTKPAAPPPRLELLEDRTVPSTVSWINSAGGDWDIASNWLDATTGQHHVPGAADDAVIDTAGITVTHSFPNSDTVHSLTSQATLALSNGSLTFNAPSTTQALSLTNSGTLTVASPDPSNPGLEVQDLTQTGGTLTGPATVTVDNALVWTGGTMSGTGHTVVNGTAEFGGSFIGPLLNGRTLDNFGTAVVDDGGRIDFSGGAVFNNEAGGILTLVGSGSLGTNFNPTRQLNNAGLLVKAGRDNSTSTIGVPLHNTGTVDVRSGTLDVKGGLTNEGTFGLEANAVATLEGTGSSNGDISLASGSRLVVVGALTLQDGSTTEVASGSQVELDSVLTQQAGSRITLAAGGLLNVGPLSFDTYTLAGGSVSGPGLVRLSTFSSQMTVTGSASIDNLSMSGGTITLTSSGSLDVQNMTQTGGTLTGAGDLTVEQSLTWTGGLMSGSGHTALHGSTEIGGSFFGPSLTGRMLDNFGSAVVDDGSALNFGGGATFNNQPGGTLDLQGSGSLTLGFNQTGQLNNAGRLLKTGRDNATSTVGVAFDNTGRVVVQSGTLSASKGLTNEGTFKLKPDAVATVTGGSSSGVFRLGAGSLLSLGGTFTLQSGGTTHLGRGSELDVTGTLTQQAGAAVTLAAGSTLSVGPGFSSGENYTLADGAAVSGPGLVRLNGLFGQSLMTVSGGAAIDNLELDNGTITVAASGGLVVGHMTQTGGTLTGAGDLTVEQSLAWAGGTMSGTGHTALHGTAEFGPFAGPTLRGRVLDNFGDATVDFFASVTLSDGAVFNNQPGATLTLLGFATLGAGIGQAPQLNNAGLVLKTGADTQSTLGLAVANSGTVEVVLGTLLINGNYTQTADGALTIHLSGLRPGTDFGQLQVGGAANLGGTLNVLLDNGFTPASGDSFRVLTFGSRTGDFATENFPDLGDGLSFSPAYDSSGLNLVVQSG